MQPYGAGPANKPDLSSGRSSNYVEIGHWKRFSLQKTEGKKEIPPSPEWLKPQKRTLSDYLIGYQGALKVLIKPIAYLSRLFETSKVRDAAEILPDCGDPELIKICFAQLDHQLETLGNIQVNTQAYGKQSLQWLRNEALRTYVELKLEPDLEPDLLELTELKNLLESVPEHTVEDDVVTVEELIGQVFARMANQCKPFQTKVYFLQESLIRFAEMGNKTVYDTTDVAKASWVEQLNDCCEALMTELMQNNDIKLLVHHHKIFATALQLTGNTESLPYQNYLVHLGNTAFKEAYTPLEKKQARAIVRKEFDRGQPLVSKNPYLVRVQQHLLEGKK